MGDMNRERFEDLKDAYALGALTFDEERAFRAYLTVHPELQAETDELAGVVSLLAFSPVDREPPKSLRKNLVRTVNDEASEVSRSRGGYGSPLASFVDYLRARPLVLGTAGLLVVGLLSWNVLLQDQLQTLRGDNSDLRAEVGSLSSTQDAQTSRVLAMSGQGEMGGVEAEVVSYERGQAVLVAKNVPQISEGETYQIWVIRNGEASPSGLFEPQTVEDSTIAAYVNQSIEDADAVAVTVEPQGGSEQPTSDPQLLASL